MQLPPHITPPAPKRNVPERAPVYALVGNPNCGKSTLFNALTGLKQKVGNYPGVTVEKKVGTAYSQHGQPLTVIDLPGAYSLAARSPDEAVTRDVLLGRRADTPQPDRVLCIIDATNLERNLYLVHQVLDLGRPVIVVLNMMDLAAEAGMKVFPDKLAKELGVPVIPCEAVRGKGLIELRLAMSRPDLPLSKHAWDVPAAISPAVAEIQTSLVTNDAKLPLIARAESLLLLTDQDSVRVAGSTPLSPRTAEILAGWQKRWSADGTDWAGTLVASRYDAIGRISAEVVHAGEAHQGPNLSDRIDAVVTHPVWGWVTLGAVMCLIFVSIFTLAEYPMNWIDGRMAALSDWVKGAMAPGDLRDLITDGAIAGVGGVVIFLPQILILFFFIGLLENTGYMARAAFIMDRLMSRVGLNGKSFIPLLSSYACAIPGIMATRTIPTPRDRIATIMVAPLMTCSARLPVYALLIGAFVPPRDVFGFNLQGVVLFALYFAGVLGALGVAWVMKRMQRGLKHHLLMLELPDYQWPDPTNLLLGLWDRTKTFIGRVGGVILALMVVLWFLSTYPAPPPGATGVPIEYSFAGRLGKAIATLFEPIGFNWQIVIALIPGLAEIGRAHV